MTCAFMASSLRLSACFIYDKRAWVTYCSLSWQWYIFETSNIADKIYFIVFSGRKWETMLECSAHNKTSLVTSVYNMFLLLHECAIYTVQCYLESSLKKSQTKHVGKINKKLQHQVVFLCAAYWSPLKKDTESINLVYFRNVEEEFRSRNQIKTSHNTWRHFALMLRSL